MTLAMLLASIKAEDPPENGSDDSGSKPDDGAVEADVPFVETGAFIAIVVVAGVVLCCTLTCISCCVSNHNWMLRTKADLETWTEIADTKMGPIEYKKHGSPPYAIFMPGTPGFGHFHLGFHLHGFGLIGISRPGYGRTPMRADANKAEVQADLCIALMDHLGIDKFPVLAASGGGCIAYRMAIQYPDRIQCLMLQCATSGSLVHPMKDDLKDPGAKMGAVSPFVGRMATHAMTSNKVMAVPIDLMTANKIQPGSFTQAEADKRAEEIKNDPYFTVMLDDMCHFMKLGCAYPVSWDAMSTDLEYYEDKIPFDQVKCPVHMIHGDCDNDIEYAQSVQAHEGIPGSVFVTIKKGTHSL